MRLTPPRWAAQASTSTSTIISTPRPVKARRKPRSAQGTLLRLDAQVQDSDARIARLKTRVNSFTHYVAKGPIEKLQADVASVQHDTIELRKTAFKVTGRRVPLPGRPIHKTLWQKLGLGIDKLEAHVARLDALLADFHKAHDRSTSAPGAVEELDSRIARFEARTAVLDALLAHVIPATARSPNCDTLVASQIDRDTWRDNPRDPATRLQSEWSTRFLKSPYHDRKRRDIINPELCHEALAILKAALPSPGSCDVIDVNPGASIWSHALHQVLQPRRHILLELEKSTYSHAIDPLLSHPDSRYRHATSLQHALDHHRDLLSPQLRHYYANLDPAKMMDLRHSPATQLIMTANLVGKNVQSFGYIGTLAKLFIGEYQRAVAFDTGPVPFHKYGLVKLLAWIPESDKATVFPRCITARFKLSKMLEASCHVREIVSSFPNDGLVSIYWAWYGAAMDNAHEVAERQRKSGISIPNYRRQPAPEPPSIYINPIRDNFDDLLSLKEKPPLVIDFLKLYRRIHQQYPEWLDEWTRKGKVPSHTPRDNADDRRRFITLRNRMKTTHNQYDKVDKIARATVRLDRQIIALRHAHPNDRDSYLALVKKLEPSYLDLQSRASKFFKDNRHHLTKAVDDYRVLNHTPHSLEWNNRQFEPLLCHPKIDFYPSEPMSLLEFTPKPEYFQRIHSPLLQTCFNYVLNILDPNRNISVQTALERLVGQKDSEAYTYFLGQVPNLTDPLHGGHWDLGGIDSRTLHMDLVIDLAVAYEKFPFRKTEVEMMDETSSLWSAGSRTNRSR